MAITKLTGLKMTKRRSKNPLEKKLQRVEAKKEKRIIKILRKAPINAISNTARSIPSTDQI